jgi:hypothetical protein
MLTPTIGVSRARSYAQLLLLPVLLLEHPL